MIRISVKDDFSRIPGHRSREDGPWSGEQFLDEILRPRFGEALKNNERLLIDLDGVAGYATSFLEAAFGGLAREGESSVILQITDFKSDEEPYLVDEIRQYIKEANQKNLGSPQAELV
jgi:hypothetical protein